MGKAVDRPPLDAFRFFDVAGRHQSFAKAARELGVTSGAVAHRVRKLEEYLGIKLFERKSHGLALSARGQALLIEVQHILCALDRTTERFRAGSKAGALKLVAVEAFAEMWLMPRLAGRHQSFAKAARELGVTSGAVAHRVRKLEEYLGIKLFERKSHGLALSARGQALLIEVQHILCALDRTTERFRAGSKAGALKLVAVEAFAEMWLMPRLAAFRSAHPEIVIEFETSLSDHYEVDPARRAFDVWIAFVAGVPRTVQSEVLFEETLVPVCSPALLASRGRPVHPADLHGWPLLYDLAWDDYWAHWFASREAGVPDMSRASGYRLYSMMVQAALEGMGVALGHSLLIAPYLEDETLVALFEPPVEAPARYFLAVAPGSEDKPEARAFLNWLRAETQKSDAAGKPAPRPTPQGEG